MKEVNIKVFVDPDWAGSISPYRVQVNQTVFRPMTLDEAKTQVNSAIDMFGVMR